mgnify:CR=1 FL=1
MSKEDLQLYEQNRFSFERPVPGQSLTNDPNQPWPWEKAPEFTNLDDAIEYFFALIVDEDNMPEILATLRRGFAVMDLTEVLLYNAFVEGKINPDMLLLLAEPVAYMLIYITDMAMFDPVILRPDENEESRTEGFDLQKTLTEDQKEKLNEDPKAVLPPNIINKLDEKVPSLLEAPQQENA